MSRHRSIAALIAALTVLGACGSDAVTQTDGDDGLAHFGSDDTACESVRLRNEVGDEQVRRSALDCFFEEYGAGRPVTIDIDVPTVEGDPIFHRYDYDGSSVLIVIDTRLDAFGVGRIDARRCAEVVRAGFDIDGVDCDDVDHPGFAEAS